MRQFAQGDAEPLRQQRDLVLLGRVPVALGVTQHVIEDHELARDQRRARVSSIAILLLVDRTIDRPRAEVIEVAAVAAIREPRREAAVHQAIEKRADVLPVPQSREGQVLPSQAVAAVERDQRDEASLPRRETEGRQRVDPVIQGHRNASR